MPSNVLPLHHKQTFPFIMWFFAEGEGDGIKSRLPFKIFSTVTATFYGNFSTFSLVFSKMIWFKSLSFSINYYENFHLQRLSHSSTETCMFFDSLVEDAYFSQLCWHFLQWGKIPTVDCFFANSRLTNKHFQMIAGMHFMCLFKFQNDNLYLQNFIWKPRVYVCYFFCFSSLFPKHIL